MGPFTAFKTEDNSYICHNKRHITYFTVYGVRYQFRTSLLHMELWSGVSVVHIHQWSDSDIPFRHTFTHTHRHTCMHTHTHMHVHIHKHVHTHALNTHAHTYMLAHTSTSGSLVYNKMVGDGSENGHSKEKMENKQNSTECTRNWCFSTLWTRLFGIWMGWSSLPDYPMPLVAGELNSLLWSLRPIDL